MLLLHQDQSKTPEHEHAVAVCKYALGVNVRRTEDPGKGRVSRKKKGYKGTGEPRSQGKGVKKGAVPHLADRGQQN